MQFIDMFDSPLRFTYNPRNKIMETEVVFNVDAPPSPRETPAFQPSSRVGSIVPALFF